MKKIEAVIIPSRVDAVRAELRRRGVCGELILTEVQHGDTDKHSITPDNGSADQLNERVKLELIVGDRQADKAVSVILRHALTDSHEPGGHVTLLDVSEVLQIIHPASDISNSRKKGQDISTPGKS
jgi:nitrogen regulatory protein P-II 1